MRQAAGLRQTIVALTTLFYFCKTVTSEDEGRCMGDVYKCLLRAEPYFKQIMAGNLAYNEDQLSDMCRDNKRIRECLETTSCPSGQGIIQQNKEFIGFNQMLIHICEQATEEYLSHQSCYERQDVIHKLQQCFQLTEELFYNNNCVTNEVLLTCVKKGTEVCGKKASRFTFELFQVYLQTAIEDCHFGTVSPLSDVDDFLTTVNLTVISQSKITDENKNEIDSKRNESQILMHEPKNQTESSSRGIGKLSLYQYIITCIIVVTLFVILATLICIISGRCYQKSFMFKLRTMRKEYMVNAQPQKTCQMYSMISLQRSPSISEPL